MKKEKAALCKGKEKPHPLDAGIDKKLIAGRWDFLTDEERARAEERGLRQKAKTMDPVKEATLRALNLRYDQDMGKLISKDVVKAMWTNAAEKIMSVLDRHLPKSSYNAVIRDIKTELGALGGELSFEPVQRKNGT